MSFEDAKNLPEDQQFWFNTYTKTVEQGAQSDYRQLIGPYASRTDAEHALETAEQRNEDWDESDREWRGQ